MILSYDAYKRLKQSQLFLANPQKSYIGVLSNIKELKLNLKFNNISEATFTLFENEDGIKNQYYDLIEPKRLVEIQNVGWFQIDESPETFDTINPYKEVKCLSLENQLVGKRIDAVDGVYALYNTSDTEHSIMHIAANACGWSVGFVDNSLINLYRTFSVDSDQVYNFLTTTVSESFQCIFQFDTYAKTINAYLLDGMGSLTDIVVSKHNLLQKCVVESFGNKIITKLKVVGDDTVDIRAVNPNGTNYLINLGYYLTTDWMSQGLITAYNTYKTAYDNAQSSWTTLMSSLKTKNSQLTVLTTALKDLKNEQGSQKNVYSSILQENNNQVPNVGTTDYTLYMNALNAYNSYFSPIASKEAEIATKTAEIASIQSQLDSLSASIDIDNFFTSTQLAELETFLTENDTYQDSTFVATDINTEEEILAMKQELMANGAKQLALYCHPQYTYKIEASNLFSIRDGRDSKISYDEWREVLDLGNMITVKLRDDYWVTSRILEIGIDFNNIEEMDIVLSEKTREDTRTTQMSELLANAGRTTTSINLHKYGYNEASSITSSVTAFMDSDLLATKNRVFSDENIQTEFSPYGILNRKWIEASNSYDVHQSLLTQNVLLFTSDNWNTAKTGIGLFTSENNETFYGVIADVICGKFILGNQLTITNSSGNYTINDTGFTATATVGSNTYVAGINPSTPNHILYASVNGVDKFYIDTVSNSLVMNGTIYSSSGIIGGWTIGSNNLTSNGSSVIQIKNNNNESMMIDYNGVSLYSWKYSGFHAGDYTVINDASQTSTFGTILSQGLDASFLAIGYNTDASSFSTGMIYTKSGFSSPNIGTFSAGFHFNQSVNVQASLTIGGYSVATQNFVANYSHTSSSLTAIYGGGAIDIGSVQACGFVYANNTFQTKSSSDERLKCEIKPLDDLPVELFLEIQPKQFKFKDGCNSYHEGIIFGFIAQDIENIFKKYGLDIWEYDLIYKTKVSEYTKENEYINDKVYRINYENFHAWEVLIIQKLWNKIVS